MYSLDTSSAQFEAVVVTTALLGTGLLSGETYELSSTTNAYVRQGTALTLTVETFAALVDGETFTLTVNGAPTVYEIDKNGTGVTPGRVQVNISTDTTNVQVAARVKTAVEAAQPMIAITDPANGTLIMNAAANTFTHADTVADVTWAAVASDPVASAADRNALVTANVPIKLNGRNGAKVSIIRVTADGVATLTRIIKE